MPCFLFGDSNIRGDRSTGWKARVKRWLLPKILGQCTGALACGRLLGTLLSGVLYQVAGVVASLWGAVVLAGIAGAVALLLPPVTADVSWGRAKGDE